MKITELQKAFEENKKISNPDRENKEYKKKYLAYLEEQVTTLHSYNILPLYDMFINAKGESKKKSASITIAVEDEVAQQVMKCMLGVPNKLDGIALLWKTKK